LERRLFRAEWRGNPDRAGAGRAGNALARHRFIGFEMLTAGWAGELHDHQTEEKPRMKHGTNTDLEGSAGASPNRQGEPPAKPTFRAAPLSLFIAC
jgi:hypothetical protein